MTDHFELSTMTGTVAMSGSAAIRRRKRVIAATPSSIASSMFTSMSWAPLATCSRAMSTASSSAPSAISRANLREPVTFVRSPTLTNALPGGGMTSAFQAGQAGLAGRFRDLARRQTGDGRGDRGDVGRRRAAAAAGDVEQAVPGPFAERLGHLLGRLVVAAQLVREAGVRVGRDRPVGDARQDVEVLAELLRSERAVEPDDQRVGVADAVPERLDGLARQGSAGRVDDGPRDDQRQPLAGLVEERLDRGDRRLRVERVEDRLDEQDVGATLDQAGGRFAVGDLELLPGDAAGGRIADVGAHRGGPVGRAERAGDEARAVGLGQFGRVGGIAGEPGGRDVQLADGRRIEAVVGLGDAGRGERVRADDVRAGIEIAGMDGGDGRRLGQAQQVAVAAEVARVVAEPLAAEVGLAEPVGLEHRPHRPVEDDDPLAEDPR